MRDQSVYTSIANILINCWLKEYFQTAFSQKVSKSMCVCVCWGSGVFYNNTRMFIQQKTTERKRERETEGGKRFVFLLLYGQKYMDIYTYVKTMGINLLLEHPPLSSAFRLSTRFFHHSVSHKSTMEVQHWNWAIRFQFIQKNNLNNLKTKVSASI